MNQIIIVMSLDCFSMISLLYDQQTNTALVTLSHSDSLQREENVTCKVTLDKKLFQPVLNFGQFVFKNDVMTFSGSTTQQILLKNVSVVTSSILSLKFAKLTLNFLDVSFSLIMTVHKVTFRKFNRLQCSDFTGIYDKISNEITLVPTAPTTTGCYSPGVTGNEVVYITLNQASKSSSVSYILKDIVTTTTDFAHYSKYFKTITLHVDPDLFLQEDFTNLNFQSKIEFSLNGELYNQTTHIDISNLRQSSTDDCFSSSTLDFFETYGVFTALPGSMEMCTADLMGQWDQAQVAIQISENGYNSTLNIDVNFILNKTLAVVFTYSSSFIAKIASLTNAALYIVDIKLLQEYSVTNKIRQFPQVWKQLIMNAAVYQVDDRFCVKSTDFGDKVVKILAIVNAHTITFRGSVTDSMPDIICTKTDLSFMEADPVVLYIDDQEVRNVKMAVLDIETIGWPFWAVFGGILVVFALILTLFVKKKLL